MNLHPFFPCGWTRRRSHVFFPSFILQLIDLLYMNGGNIYGELVGKYTDIPYNGFYGNQLLVHWWFGPNFERGTDGCNKGSISNV